MPSDHQCLTVRYSKMLHCRIHADQQCSISVINKTWPHSCKVPTSVKAIAIHIERNNESWNYSWNYILAPVVQLGQKWLLMVKRGMQLGYIMKNIFTEPLLLFYLRASDYIMSFSSIAVMHCAVLLHIKKSCGNLCTPESCGTGDP